jgi:hypothetical protein
MVAAAVMKRRRWSQAQTSTRRANDFRTVKWQWPQRNRGIIPTGAQMGALQYGSP